MAFLGNNDDEEQSSASNNAKAATAAAQGTPYGGATGGFAGGTGTGSGQGATTTQPATSTSNQPSAPTSSYANLSQYLNANQSTGGTTGQAAENVVQQSANQAKQAQGVYDSKASSEIADASKAVGVNQDTIGSIKAGTASTDQDTLNKIAQGGYTYNPTQVADYGKADKSVLDSIIASGGNATGAYTGPTDFSQVVYGGPALNQVAVGYKGPTSSDVGGFGADTEAARAAAIQQNGVVQGNVGNAQGGQTGVSALLRQAYQQPNYTAGENSLDAFLSGGTEAGRQALAQAPGVGKDVSDSYAGINAALQGKIKGGLDLADTTNNAYQNAIDEATKASGATKASYDTAVQTAKDKAVADKKIADEQVKKATDEKATRAAAEKKAADDAAVAAAVAKAAAPATGGKTLMDIINPGNTIAGALKTAGGQIASETKKVTAPVVTDVKNLGTNIANTPGSVASDLKGTLQGNTKSTNNLATTVATGGLNKLAPATTKTATTAVKAAAPLAARAVNTNINPTKAIGNAIPAAQPVTNAVTHAGNTVVDTAKKAGGTIAKTIKGLYSAHGGEVPSYEELIKRLRGC